MSLALLASPSSRVPPGPLNPTAACMYMRTHTCTHTEEEKLGFLEQASCRSRCHSCFAKILQCYIWKRQKDPPI